MILLGEHDEPSLAVQQKRRCGPSASLTSTPKNRVWGFENHPSGRSCSSPDLSGENATGSVQFSYEIASGRIEHYQYDPFGNVIAQTGSLRQNYQWSSKEVDASTGLVYYLYRFYNPASSRWQNRDPDAENGGLNLYSSVYNDSISNVDTSGLFVYNFPGIGPIDIPIPEVPFPWPRPTPRPVNPGPALDLLWNPWRDSSFSITITFPTDDTDDKVQQIYNDLKVFNHFADPSNSGGAVFLEGQVANFRGPFWPPAAESQFLGSLPGINKITDLTYWNKVDLSYDDAGRQVRGDTEPGHIVQGSRYWSAEKGDKPCTVKVSTWAHERSANALAEGTRKIFNFSFGDLQTAVWTDYLNNIGNYWKASTNATFVDGPYTLTNANQ